MRDMRGRGHGFPFPGDGASTLPAESDAKYNGAGFRLAKDGIDEYRFRWGRSFTVPPEHAAQGICLEDYPAFRNQRIGIRLIADWSHNE